MANAVETADGAAVDGLQLARRVRPGGGDGQQRKSEQQTPPSRAFVAVVGSSSSDSRTASTEVHNQ